MIGEVREDEPVLAEDAAGRGDRTRELEENFDAEEAVHGVDACAVMT